MSRVYSFDNPFSLTLNAAFSPCLSMVIDSTSQGISEVMVVNSFLLNRNNEVVRILKIDQKR